MNTVVIASAVRTPIGNFLGSLSELSAVELGTIVAKEAIRRAGILPEHVEEVVAGVVYKAGLGGNPARQIQLKCGIPVEAPAVTVEQQCASGMRAIEIAAQQIMLGRADITLAVGMESMSNVPHLLVGGRRGYKLGSLQLEDALLRDALHDAFYGYHMAITAEKLAEEYGITREEQDRLAFLSHQRAVAAIKEGKFAEEIVPVEINNPVKGRKIVNVDEHPRADTTLEALAKLPPVFKENGTITAGNASGINDGAAALILMSEVRAKEVGVSPLGRLVASVSRGVSPEVMGIGPAYAIPEALKEAGLSLKDIGYFEINEAFAAQFLAVMRELNLNIEYVNSNGSGISLGHPLGCTGARIVVTMLCEMKRRGCMYGVASLCAGGGPAMAMVIENPRS